MDVIVDLVRASGVGVLHGMLPQTAPGSAMLRAVSTRALNRARRVAKPSDEIDAVIGTLFGERWVSSRTLGLGMVHSSFDITEPEDPYADRAGDEAAGAAAATLEAIESQLAELQSRRALRLADAAGSLKSSRSAADTIFALKAITRAVRGGNQAPTDTGQIDPSEPVP
jgi:hypothetical protein